MAAPTNQGQTGDFNMNAFSGTLTGDIVTGVKISSEAPPTPAEIDAALGPVAEAIAAAPPEARAAAQEKLEAVKAEAAKGKDADDKTMGRLIQGLVALVPGAVNAVTSAFATPLLGALAGRLTKSAIEMMGGD